MNIDWIYNIISDSYGAIYSKYTLLILQYLSDNLDKE